MAPTAPLKPLARAILGTQPDARLVTLTREGSEDAFAEIVRRHRPGLLRFARSLGSGERCEDVVQDGLIRAWKALRKSDAEIDLRPWLTTIVRNRALSAHAAARHHEELDETIDGVRQPSDIALMHEELRSAVSAVNSLPAAQREALVRSALQGESHERIAAELDTTPGAVRQLIFRARTGLRDGMGALVPLPAVRWVVDLTTHEAAAGGTATGSVAAIAAGAGGGSIVLKAVTVIAVGAAVAGGGVAIERHRSDGDGGPAEAKAAPVSETGAETSPATGGSGSGSPTTVTPSTAATETTTTRQAAGAGSARPTTSQTSTIETAQGSDPVTTTSDQDSDSVRSPTQEGAQQQQPPPPGETTETAPPPPPPDGTDHHHDGDGTQTQPPPPPPPDDNTLDGTLDGWGGGSGPRDGGYDTRGSGYGGDGLADGLDSGSFDSGSGDPHHH